ncbi:hypothetical protein IWQ60_012234 [Tieghemiomyces parasiticus]|uniref:peptidyl-tRNA hydrolase n=1 Tax=Tieghemiomyces parasiticus TaxID=78921 RepID=A0A9W7ZP29_9FUNG|nr:hypothetical protein IWQ60_012234 [Tieghemiomyces parasiticus]
MAEPLTMFIIVRKDLIKACHATSAALWQFKDTPQVQDYVANLDGMHKVVLETKNEASLRKAAEGLQAKGIDYYMWVEQPENILTCLATAPTQRSLVSEVTKKCQLWR